jgi:hypothetical protein
MSSPRADVTERLRLIADMRRGAPFPPPGIDNPEDWTDNNWNVGMSALLREARREILRLRHENGHLRRTLNDVIYTGRWILLAAGAFLGSTVALALYAVLQ